MNSKEKLQRVLVKYPELKQVIKELSQKETLRKVLQKEISSPSNKLIVVGRDTDTIYHLYELALIMKEGYLHRTQVTTLDLLDAYLGSEHLDQDLESTRYQSLSQVEDQLVLIDDTRAYISHRQKTNFVMQVFEQNERVLYHYRSSIQSFKNEHSALIDYAREQGITIVYPKEGIKQSNVSKAPVSLQGFEEI